jgi:hypothetical protein
MEETADPLELIQRLVGEGKYRVRLHAVRHMIEEGFDEKQLLEALRGKAVMVEAYEEEGRYLVLGTFHFTKRASSPLHVLCDVSVAEMVDVVTAYIPQRPWWESPTQRGTRR